MPTRRERGRVPKGAKAHGRFKRPKGLPPPLITLLSPVDNAVDVAIDATLVATFDKDIQLGAAGTVLLKQASDDATIDSWDVSADEGSGAGQLEVTNNDELTLHLTSNLTNDVEYYVIWDIGVVLNVYGNPVSPLTFTTAWSFTTVAS